MSKRGVHSRPRELSAVLRLATLMLGAAVLLASVVALARALFGFAPMPAAARELAVAVHVGSVVPAIALGLAIFTFPKGTARHRLLGKLWLGLMVLAAASSFFIRHINDGSLSFIHLFSVATLIAIPMAIVSARQGRIAVHRSQLVGLFIGSLLVAGMFSFLPGRIMHAWLLG